MTLFIRTENRLFEISDAYAMALTFLIFFATGKVVKTVIEKRKQKNLKNVTMINPRGGNTGLQFSDDTELAYTILTCIADNERYIIKDPQVIKIIFGLVKAKIKNESLVLTPNMLRFLALKLINNDQTLIVKIGNILMSSSNQARLFARLFGSAIIAFVGALFSIFPQAVLIMVLYFNATQNCGYKCDDYFERLPKKGPVEIHGKVSTGHLVIAGNDDARQLDIYIPSKVANEVITSNNGQLKRTETYTKSRTKAKLITFSEFKKTDPVLSRFDKLDEPQIPQKKCPVNDIHDIIDVQVD